MKSSKLPGILSVKSKKGLDYMDMILKTTDLCKNFKGQMAVNNVSPFQYAPDKAVSLNALSALV